LEPLLRTSRKRLCDWQSLAGAREGWPDQSSELIADDLVALAGRGLEPDPIDDLNQAALMVNVSCGRNVSHRVFPDLTHVSLIESAKGATAAGDAILAVVTSVRSGTRLDAPAARR